MSLVVQRNAIGLGGIFLTQDGQEIDAKKKKYWPGIKQNISVKCVCQMDEDANQIKRKESRNSNLYFYRFGGPLRYDGRRVG